MDFLLALDPTVQVALIGVVGAIGTAVWATMRAVLAPKTEKGEAEYGPRPHILAFDEVDRLRIDRMIYVLESMTDTIERHRIEISMRDHR